MPNLLKVAMIDTILSLYRQGWSQRRIARELEINRETVARYIKQARAAPKPAIAPTGSEPLQSDAKPAIAPTGSDSLETAPADPSLGSTPARVEHRRGRKSECEPWRD